VEKRELRYIIGKLGGDGKALLEVLICPLTQ